MLEQLITQIKKPAAAKMKVLIADIRPADVVLAAALLQISEAEARRFLNAAKARMGPIETACVRAAPAVP